MEERQAFGTMHVKNGWNFSRLPDGGVKIHKTDLNAVGQHYPPCDPRDYEQHRRRDDDNAPLVEITIPANEWESVIASVSAYGDSARGFSLAQAFHQAAGNLHLDEGDISEDAVRSDNVTDAGN